MQIDERRQDPAPRPILPGPDDPPVRVPDRRGAQAGPSCKPEAVGCVFAEVGVQIVERSAADYADYLDEL